MAKEKVIKKVILYIEDELELAVEFIEELTEHGFDVVHSVDYHDAIVKASNQVFDLLIVDMHLKHGTGDKIIELIKKNPRHLNFKTPVIVASSQITLSVVRNVGEYIDHAFVKPFKFSELISKVQCFIKK